MAGRIAAVAGLDTAVIAGFKTWVLRRQVGAQNAVTAERLLALTGAGVADLGVAVIAGFFTIP